MKLNVFDTTNRVFLWALSMLLLVNINQVSAQEDMSSDDRAYFSTTIRKHYQNKNWSEGKKILDKGLEKYPHDSDLKMLLGKFYFERKEYDLARFHLLKSLVYNVGNVGSKQLLVNVEIESKRYSSAICYINELLEVNPYDKELWIKKIETHRLEGNDIEAARLLKRIHQIYPDDKDVKSAYLYYVEQELVSKKNSGGISDAIRLATIMVEKDPGNESYYIELINNYIKAGDTEKALSYSDRGLYNLPGSMALIDKKIGILSSLNKYDEILTFIQMKIKEGQNKVYLEKQYDYFLEETAHYRRRSDLYTLYQTLFERNPRNEEAFNYIVGNAATKGLYDDALDAIKKVKSIQGETKDVLLKEQLVFQQMGAQSKADQLTIRLYQLYPEDSEVKYKYIQYRLLQAKSLMAEELYDKALNHWKFVAEYGNQDQAATAMPSVYNCLYHLGKFNDALLVLDQLILEYPDESEWNLKKAVIFGKQKKYFQALDEYKKIFNITEEWDKEWILGGYEELATVYTKELIEASLLSDAMRLIEQWLEFNPKSEQGTRYAINVSSQMKDYDGVMKYALLGLDNNPEVAYYQIKQAEAYNIQKKHRKSLDILVPEVIKNPYDKELIGAHSQASEDYARQLTAESKYEESLAILSSALLHDSNNKALKYLKGINYEKMSVSDSAYYYQSFYEPGVLEIKEFTNHLKFLKSKTYKNQVGFAYLRSDFDQKDQISTISTVQYTRFGVKDTYTGVLNYTGREDGKGIQAQLEWNRKVKADIQTRVDASVSTKIFAKFITNGSIYKSFKNDWEAELGIGYRIMANDDNMANVVIGITKQADPWWLNARLNTLMLDGKWYYNASSQARFYFLNPRSYLTAMASIGSAPDVDVIDNQLYNGFSVTNSMVGLGVQHLISDVFSAGVLGTCYNYQDYDKHYQNLYNLHLQLYVRF